MSFGIDGKHESPCPFRLIPSRLASQSDTARPGRLQRPNAAIGNARPEIHAAFLKTSDWSQFDCRWRNGRDCPKQQMAYRVVAHVEFNEVAGYVNIVIHAQAANATTLTPSCHPHPDIVRNFEFFLNLCRTVRGKKRFGCRLFIWSTNYGSLEGKKCDCSCTRLWYRYAWCCQNHFCHRGFSVQPLDLDHPSVVAGLAHDFRSPVQFINVIVFDSIVLAWAIPGIFLLYWLNLPDVRDWFNAKSQGISA
jgi:hypothetical protein